MGPGDLFCNLDGNPHSRRHTTLTIHGSPVVAALRANSPRIVSVRAGNASMAALALQSHRTEGSNFPDPVFIEKLRDIVGLYLNPPDRAPGLVRG